MKFFLLTMAILLLTHCSKPKTALICGDHVCIKIYVKIPLNVGIKCGLKEKLIFFFVNFENC